MAFCPQVVWSNPHPIPHFTMTARMLAHLSEAIISRVEEGHMETARGLMSLYTLSPIEAGIVADRLFRAGLPEETVLQLM